MMIFSKKSKFLYFQLFIPYLIAALILAVLAGIFHHQIWGDVFSAISPILMIIAVVIYFKN